LKTGWHDFHRLLREQSENAIPKSVPSWNGLRNLLFPQPAYKKQILNASGGRFRSRMHNPQP
jgi:hypothetical protein